MVAATKPEKVMPHADWYDDLGLCVIPMRTDQKASKGRWKQFQQKRPNKEQLRLWFTDTDTQLLGLGIVCGRVSGGLLVRDFDSQPAYNAWKASNASLAKVLPTVETRRGFHVYATCGLYLPRGRRTFIYNFDDGELRGDGGLVVAPPSIHPDSRKPYRWIKKPTGAIPEVPLQTFGLTPQPGCVTQDVSVLHGWGLPEPVEEAIEETVPCAIGQRNAQVFAFARKLKGMQEYCDAAASDPELLKFVEAWYEVAEPYVATQNLQVTLKDFIRGWPQVKWPDCGGSITRAVDCVKATEPPPEALATFNPEYDDPELLVLAGICRELQRQRGERNFYLSTRIAAKALGITGAEPQVKAHRWLNKLCKRGIVRLEKVGTLAGMRASEFRYLGSLDNGRDEATELQTRGNDNADEG